MFENNSSGHNLLSLAKTAISKFEIFNIIETTANYDRNLTLQNIACISKKFGHQAYWNMYEIFRNEVEMSII